MVFGLAAAIHGGVILAAFWVLPFLAFGLYLAIGRFFFKAARRRNTLYAVTNERVITRAGGTTRSIPLTNLPGMEVTSGRTRGRIVFGSFNPLAAVYANYGLDWFGSIYGSLPMTFFDIAHPDSVAMTIEDARRAAASRPKEENSDNKVSSHSGGLENEEH